MSELSRILLDKSRCLVLQPEVVEKLGTVESIVLQQIHYLLTSDGITGKVHNGNKWIYNSIKALAESIKIYSEKTIWRAIKRLESLGLLLSNKLHKFKGNQTKWYTIAYDVLAKILKKPSGAAETLIWTKCPSGMDKMSKSLTEKTTEINTGLNNAREGVIPDPVETFETLSSVVIEEKQPEVISESIVYSPTGSHTLEASSSLEEQILQDLEALLAEMAQPSALKKPSALKAIRKLLPSHLGGLEGAKEYFNKIKSNAFLMGKKAMKSGDKFCLSVGAILSPRTIEASWKDNGPFQVWEDKPEKESITRKENAEMARPKPNVLLPYLELSEVLESAKDEKDKAVKENLYKRLGETTYKSWFHSQGFAVKGTKNGLPEFYITSPFARDYINTHFADQLRKAFG